MRKEDFGFKYKGKNINLKVGICDDIFSQSYGLMFKKTSIPLLFLFKKSRKRSIHSFFCEKFVAIWFDKNEIVDVKTVDPWRININPGKNFDKLLEIPLSNGNSFDFIDDAKHLNR